MAFRSQLKIRFGDIDRAGIVYYPRFMHYFHVALEEFFAGKLGMSGAAGQKKASLIEKEEVSVLKIDCSSIGFGDRVFNKGELEPRIVGHNVTVCLDMERKKNCRFRTGSGSSLSNS